MPGRFHLDRIENPVRVLRSFANDRRKLDKFTFACSKCGKPVRASERVWTAILDGAVTGDGMGHLGKWGHGACVR